MASVGMLGWSTCRLGTAASDGTLATEVPAGHGQKQSGSASSCPLMPRGAAGTLGLACTLGLLQKYCNCSHDALPRAMASGRSLGLHTLLCGSQTVPQLTMQGQCTDCYSCTLSTGTQRM